MLACSLWDLQKKEKEESAKIHRKEHRMVLMNGSKMASLPLLRHSKFRS